MIHNINAHWYYSIHIFESILSNLNPFVLTIGFVDASWNTRKALVICHFVTQIENIASEFLDASWSTCISEAFLICHLDSQVPINRIVTEIVLFSYFDGCFPLSLGLIVFSNSAEVFGCTWWHGSDQKKAWQARKGLTR